MVSQYKNHIISDITSYVARFSTTVISQEVVAFLIEGITACLGHSTVVLTLLLNAAECPELPFATVA